VAHFILEPRVCERFLEIVHRMQLSRRHVAWGLRILLGSSIGFHNSLLRKIDRMLVDALLVGLLEASLGDVAGLM